MRITFKLYATLSGFLPAGTEKHAIRIEVPEQVTACDIIDRYQVPRDMAHLVLLNGVFLPPEARVEPGRIKEGDTLAIWPPVAGG